MKDLDSKEIVGAEELANVTAVINSGNMWRMGGLFVDRFEDEMAAHLGRKYVYAVNSGTSANEAIVAGLGIEPGDEVICPSSTPIFATMPVFAASGIPVFADSDPRTTMITPEGIEAVVSKRSKAIFVVHAFGQVAPMDKIMAMAKKHNLKVLEDCAQAYDCYFEDKMTGAIGDSSCFSMQQSKHITSGEGGFVSTDDPEMYKKMVLYSNAGMPWYRFGVENTHKKEVINGIPTRGHFGYGHNHRMGDLQAAVGVAQIPKIAKFAVQRKRVTDAYEEVLKDCPGILLAHQEPNTKHSYWLYPLRIDPATNTTSHKFAEECMELTGFNISCFCEISYLEYIYQECEKARRTPFGYPLPDNVHYTPGTCPNAEKTARSILCLGSHHSETVEGARKLAEAIRTTAEKMFK